MEKQGHRDPCGPRPSERAFVATQAAYGPRTVAEIARVLAPRGHVLVRNPTREAVMEYEYLQFFPEARAFDLARMPPRDVLVATFAARGLEATAHRVVRHPFAGSAREYLAKISARAISSLQAISDRAFRHGLAALERHAGQAPDRPIHEPVDTFLFRAPS